MRVLITNQFLDKPSGTDRYVCDLARGLLQRNCLPAVYSPHPGQAADELRRSTVPVVDRLAKMTTTPDVIHGHHSHPTMAALAAFPHTPAVYFCHDWDAWHDRPLDHPRVLRHVAVDQTCYDRLVCLGGVPEDRALLLPNWVDLGRFTPRAPLPARPRRALVFNNLIRLAGRRDPFRTACRAEGIELDFAGAASGGSVAHPEQMLGRYDVVFARGKSAMEALAVGAAVVLCGFGRLGPMVTPEALDTLRGQNFGRRAIQTPLTAEGVRTQLARYNPAEAAQASARVRGECGMTPVIDALVGLYAQVIAEHAAAPPNAAAEGRAVAAYLEETQQMVELGAARWRRKQREAELRAAGAPGLLARIAWPRRRRAG
ncbi:hypothetical protein Pla175_03420 [Pirellulimonas nuda]|uniref:Glycosyltransferase subfamily 4-like N-terminal domain-containing protein n=1 Tax=Pirellulimonas nuda TaxID=2528009 RepID=A0A518D688_9BACT|nr:glycosyltransferase [Pirellulimonas nuda]QDU86988.1 hypothetical protein Pla175_03420 [Pirellulimonas nuda]